MAWWKELTYWHCHTTVLIQLSCQGLFLFFLSYNVPFPSGFKANPIASLSPSFHTFDWILGFFYLVSCVWHSSLWNSLFWPEVSHFIFFDFQNPTLLSTLTLDKPRTHWFGQPTCLLIANTTHSIMHCYATHSSTLQQTLALVPQWRCMVSDSSLPLLLPTPRSPSDWGGELPPAAVLSYSDAVRVRNPTKMKLSIETQPEMDEGLTTQHTYPNDNDKSIPHPGQSEDEVWTTVVLNVTCYNLFVHLAVSSITHLALYLVAPLHLATCLLIVLCNLVVLGHTSSGQSFFLSIFTLSMCAEVCWPAILILSRSHQYLVNSFRYQYSILTPSMCAKSIHLDLNIEEVTRIVWQCNGVWRHKMPRSWGICFCTECSREEPVGTRKTAHKQTDRKAHLMQREWVSFIEGNWPLLTQREETDPANWGGILFSGWKLDVDAQWVVLSDWNNQWELLNVSRNLFISRNLYDEAKTKASKPTPQVDTRSSETSPSDSKNPEKVRRWLGKCCVRVATDLSESRIIPSTPGSGKYQLEERADIHPVERMIKKALIAK